MQASEEKLLYVLLTAIFCFAIENASETENVDRINDFSTRAERYG